MFGKISRVEEQCRRGAIMKTPLNGLMDNGTDWLFSFTNICDLIGL